jgi:hypothetical protein
VMTVRKTSSRNPLRNVLRGFALGAGAVSAVASLSPDAAAQAISGSRGSRSIAGELAVQATARTPATIGETLSPRDVCEAVPPFLSGLSSASRSDNGPLALGARRIMVATYQNCSVLTDAPYDPSLHPISGLVTREATFDGSVRNYRAISSSSDVVESHYYLQNPPAPIPPGCLDPRSPPPVYSYGAKPSISGGTINMTADLSRGSCDRYNGYSCSGSPARGIDCSGFVHAALAAAGMRLFQGRPLDPANQGTGSILEAGISRTGCFSSVPSNMTDRGGLRSGDLFVVRGNHVVIIDSAGPDPFGIGRIRDVDGCEDLTPESFDFRILQSSGSGNGIGVNRMEAKTYFGAMYEEAMASHTATEESPRPSGESFGFLGPLLEHARAACRVAKAPGVAIEVTPRTGRILRHRGGAACSQPPADPGSSDCTDSCDLNQRGGVSAVHSPPRKDQEIPWGQFAHGLSKSLWGSPHG